MKHGPTMMAVCVCATLALSGCSWQSYVAARTIRYFDGAPTRLHQIVLANGALHPYRKIEMRSVENLIGDHLSPAMEAYCNEQILKALQSVKAKPEVTPFSEDPVDEQATPTTPINSTLIFEGYIDDYDPGYAGLRLVELGFNHVAVTVRFQLRDKDTGQIVGAASVTAQDNRVTATAKHTIHRLAERVTSFVNTGYGNGSR